MQAWRRYLGLAVIAGVFAFVAWLLYHQLAQFHYHDVLASLRAIPASRVALALGLTVCSYLVLIGYDYLAVRETGPQLSLPQIALAAFGGSVTSYNFGVLLGGTSVRYRLYSLWGCSTLEIVRIVALVSANFWIALCALGGLVFTFAPLPIPERYDLPFDNARPLGLVLLALLGLYLAWCGLQRRPIVVRGMEFAPPKFKTAVLQVLVGIADLTLAAAVPYVLMPESLDVSFFHFVAAYLLAMVLVICTYVPGGLGVLELGILTLLAPKEPQAVLGGILAFRAIYYLLPLLVATALLGINELLGRREHVGKVVAAISQAGRAIGPRVISLLVIVAGALLLFSGATPPMPERLRWLHHLLPLPVLEVSHFLGSVIGMALLILGQALRRRLDSAYWLTLMLLLAGALFSLLKGFDYEEAIALLIMAILLIPLREQFHRRGRLLEQPWKPGWILTVALVVASSLAIGFFVHKRVDYSDDLWWKFAFSADTSRFLRASMGVLCVALFVSLAALLRVAPRVPQLPDSAALEQAATVIASSSETHGNLALLGDKTLLFSDSGQGLLMYGVAGRSWVALGDPIAPQEERAELAWRFRELCDYHSGWPVFYQVNQESLPLYLDLGLNLLKLGEEARVPLTDFSLEGKSRKSLRQVYRHLERDGLEFAVLPVEETQAALPRLRAISDAWLAEKNTREKRFSLGFFSEAYLRRYPTAVIRRGDEILAFANMWQSGDQSELSVDLMRHTDQAPHGVMDQLFTGLMLWGHDHGYEWFNLGMAPLAGLENRQLAPLWHRVGGLLFRHGENFYNFEGLRDYKDKFDPVWRPKYLASPGGWALPIILANVATLISGGVKGLVAK
ncbi:MAG TPA: bifunctional lysylphosphatidylglycerol flippase/synthetase MprF [Pirellulaceae bacterium]|nr:bifunctional lysylphosphatidylglycerol flippase/synthetase MprF [Pirellulaceae bacterium]